MLFVRVLVGQRVVNNALFEGGTTGLRQRMSRCTTESTSCAKTGTMDASVWTSTLLSDREVTETAGVDRIFAPDKAEHLAVLMRLD